MDIAALSDKALELMAAGQYMQASREFRAAWDSLKDWSNLDQDQLSTDITRLEFLSLGLASEMYGSYWMHTHAVRIANESDKNRPSCAGCRTHHLMAVLFNLALCYHMQGLQGNKQVDLLSKALNFYRAAHALASTISPSNETGHVLMLATINNMGHIHALLHEKEEEQSCLLMMRNLISSYGLTPCMDGYYMNVVLCLGQKCHAATA